MAKTDLKGLWKLSGANIETTATIPGDFHSALLKNQIIKDPFYGFNEQDSLWVGKTDWTIDRTFDFKKIADTKAILQITEADTFFNVFLNEILVGEGHNAFARHRFDVTDAVKDGQNKIRIIFYSTENKNLEIEKNLPYPSPCMQADVYSPARNLSRKCQCHGGWDWGPCIMVSGIYDDIFIDQVADGLFEGITISYNQINKEDWEATIKVGFNAYNELPKKFSFEISGSDIQTVHSEETFYLNNGQNLIEQKLVVKNPFVWKTADELKENHLEENILYKLKITTTDSSGSIKEQERSICFNKLKAVSNKDFNNDKEGRSLYFENNGKKIFAKGNNWIPAEFFTEKLTEQRYKDLLKSAVDANNNCIRVWGGGFYEKEIFYELCDKLGLIVWQDCMFACGTYPMTEDFLTQVKLELDYNVPRLQTHACIGLWCGNNENFGALDWFKESRENKVRYLVDYDRLYNGLIGPIIKKYDPEKLFWPSSPCSGPDDFADNWHSDNMGDMHYWSVWHERKDKEAYMSIKPRFVSEFGYQSFPSIQTMNSFAEEKDFNLTSELMEYHQRSPSGNSIILENFSRYFKFPNGFENMIYLSQVQQAVAIRTAVDWWRSLKPSCYGALVWQLNDIWPGPSWSSLEYSGKWKLLHYEEQKFFQTVSCSAFIKDGKLNVYAVSDASTKVKGKISIRHIKYSDCTEIPQAKVLSFSLDADEVLNVLQEDINNNQKKEYFILVKMEAEDELNNKYESENTVFPSVYKHANIKKCNITKEIEKKEKDFIITLSTDNAAFFVSLDTKNIQGKFSTNMLTLLPENKTKVVFTACKDIPIQDFEKDLLIFDLSNTY